MANKWDIDGVSASTTNVVTASGGFVGGVTGAVTGDVTGNVTGYIILPTSDPAVAGALWNNAGTPTISAG